MQLLSCVLKWYNPHDSIIMGVVLHGVLHGVAQVLIKSEYCHDLHHNYYYSMHALL